MPSHLLHSPVPLHSVQFSLLSSTPLPLHVWHFLSPLHLGQSILIALPVPLQVVHFSSTSPVALQLSQSTTLVPLQVAQTSPSSSTPVPLQSGQVTVLLPLQTEQVALTLPSVQSGHLFLLLAKTL